MQRFMFVIDGRGIESWYPVDEKVGPSEYGGKFYGLEFYQYRARANWDRGCYYMEAELTAKQEETLKKLLAEKDWLGGKEFIESITERNFETETGYENPFDPDWKPDFGPEWEAKHRIWRRRAGLNYLNTPDNAEEKIRGLKIKISTVFEKLEKEGYLARMNYCCCRNCADAALEDEARVKGEEGKLIKGIVHYNEQGEECLWENGFVYLCYRALNGTGNSITLTKELGEYLVKNFEGAGAIVDWNGNPDRTICLYAC